MKKIFKNQITKLRDNVLQNPLLRSKITYIVNYFPNFKIRLKGLAPKRLEIAQRENFIEQQKGYIHRALNQYQDQINKELKQKDEQLHSKQDLIKALNKKIIDLYQMVSSKNPLNIIRAIGFIKKYHKDTL